VKLAQCKKFKDLPRVKLAPLAPGAERQSRFWRYSRLKGEGSGMFNKSNVNTFLSSIEALHCFCIGYAEHKLDKFDVNMYDNILWLFAFNYTRVKKVYESEPGKRARIMRKSKGLLKEF
jgi:hypothetical protein